MSRTRPPDHLPRQALTETAQSPLQMPSTPRFVSIVVTFYNEGEAVEPFYRALRGVLDGITDNSFEIICVDDGSRDDTLLRLISLVDRDPRWSIIELSLATSARKRHSRPASMLPKAMP
jgi:cellulose synthase/poly-beta-1,6-N-acetylglucosamine synthase-like glycosyltransferase